MGYQPMPRNPPPPTKSDEGIINLATMLEIHQHLHILVLRKSAGKLIEYIMQFRNKKQATNAIIQTKYELSKCRPEVLAMMLSMAKDPRRFKFADTTCDSRMVLNDTVHGTYFQIYNFSSNPNRYLPKVYINSKEFLNDNEEMVLFKIVKSMNMMRNNEYKLQEELKTLEEQENVFQIYQNEKLLS
ncbi:hypothetical protein FDH34_gp144 [Serratia phage BF]|uniref:Uncharacterized protein n=2 Tax=Eneladusvirus BF TaxID=2560751 RepID=A0A7L8ZMX7_9CAUD|nr:hypothetical protein FDH34_gp144 [Serratia phage BF]AQW88669.1 hypothetical protein BF_0144 [Serratia phage BF]QOI71627.1 hypothetical protein pEaSNUABM47_00143 [Erwinia phage pEa_SNUABM_47]QXO11840.1 hypothetical protein pEaSNUABM44_00144 [Erwinia phage pEa_SNUABM_44]QXO12392.1 hypothetical protein pEaSNUABM49_00146 [Erwinia phage pEa_SNUABM_49]